MKQHKFMNIVAGVAVFLNAASPAFAATFTISGNGSSSDNFVTSTVEKSVEVEQNNDADINNSIKVSTDTGSNTVKDNTGGNVSIDTGSTEVGVKVDNQLNTNLAEVDTCNGCGTDSTIKIADNGTGTKNVVATEHSSEVDLDQDNDANVSNDVNVLANSGSNNAKDNTGGEVEILTGMVKVNPVVVTNKLNTNAAVVTSGDQNGETSLMITGNGSRSENFIDLAVGSEIDLDQDNDARVTNGVFVAGESGDNSVKGNTGGETIIDTGSVEVGVLVDTQANFNMAEIADCCLVDVEGKIDGNGTRSDNVITAELGSELEVDQDNDLSCGSGNKYDFLSRMMGHGCNDVNVGASTGANDVKDSTVGGDDPSIDTGSADVGIQVENSGNVNQYGTGEFELPGGSTSVDIDLDMSGVMSLLNQILNMLGN